jgi:hypothetical protein
VAEQAEREKQPGGPADQPGGRRLGDSC